MNTPRRLSPYAMDAFFAVKTVGARILALALVLVIDGLVRRNFHAPLSVQCLSSLFLNALVEGASTTCCGNSFQQLITLLLKNDFRTVVWNIMEQTTSSNALLICECVRCGQLPWCVKLRDVD